MVEFQKNTQKEARFRLAQFTPEDSSDGNVATQVASGALLTKGWPTALFSLLYRASCTVVVFNSSTALFVGQSVKNILFFCEITVQNILNFCSFFLFCSCCYNLNFLFVCVRKDEFVLMLL